MRLRNLTLTLLAVPGLLLLGVGVVEGRADEPAGSSGKPPAGLLRITGSSTMCPVIAAIGERFRTVRPDVRIDVQCGGSERGIKDVREGTAEIGMSTRVLKADEKDLLGFPIARDGVSVIVHKSNPVGALSDEQIAGIFSGEIGTWQALNGRNAPIAVVLRELERPVSELFQKYFKLTGRLRGRMIAGDNPVTISAVAADPDAIAYVSSGQAEREATGGVGIRLLPVGGVMPTGRNVITGNYPITRPLSLVTRGLPAGTTKEFVNYCLSPKVVDIIEKFDFVPYED